MDSFSDASVNLSNFLGSVQSEAPLCMNTKIADTDMLHQHLAIPPLVF